MHCPQCGTRIESEEISYCTRCGQMLERIRVAMSDEAVIARGTKVSRSGLNVGVVLMYAGLWPALLALILSPSALPVALVLLNVALAAILLGSGPLVRLFQTDEIHPEVERARRKEIAFGSILMYIGTIMATLFVITGVPDAWAKVMLIGSITAVFGGLLAASKPLYGAYRSLASNDPIMLRRLEVNRELTTASLDTDALELQMPPTDGRTKDDNRLPPSVTDETTRLLDERAEPK